MRWAHSAQRSTLPSTPLDATGARRTLSVVSGRGIKNKYSDYAILRDKELRLPGVKSPYSHIFAHPACHILRVWVFSAQGAKQAKEGSELYCCLLLKRGPSIRCQIEPINPCAAWQSSTCGWTAGLLHLFYSILLCSMPVPPIRERIYKCPPSTLSPQPSTGKRNQGGPMVFLDF